MRKNMKRTLLLLITMAIAIPGFGQKTSTSYVERFWGTPAVTGHGPFGNTGLQYSAPSPTADTDRSGFYQEIGSSLYCTVDGVWMTVTGQRLFDYPNIDNNYSPPVLVTTLGFSDGYSLDRTSFFGEEIKNYIEDNYSNMTRELLMFIKVPPTVTGYSSPIATVTGTFRTKTLSGCRVNYTIPTNQTVAGEMLIELGTPPLSSVRAIDPSLFYGTNSIESGWVNLGVSGAFWDGFLGNDFIDISANPNVILNYEYTGNSGGLIQLDGVSNNNNTVSGVSTATSAINIGSNSTVLQIINAPNYLTDIRLRTSNAMGTMKIKSILMGFAPTQTISIGGITEISPGTVAKYTNFDLSFISTPSSSLQGYANVTIIDPNQIATYLVTNTITGAIRLALIGDGSVTIVGTSIDNDNIGFRKVISTQKSTQSIQGLGSNRSISISNSYLQFNAFATSGLPVTYVSSNTNIASFSGNQLDFNTTGIVTITANQIGNGAYFPTSLTTVLTITTSLLSQSITNSAVPSKTTSDVPFNLQATASSGLPVSFQVLSGPASVSGNQVTLNGTSGVVTIRASQAGNSSFLAAPSVDFSFAVSSPILQNQTISFPDVVAKVSTDLPFNLTATASSGLPISYTLVQGPATLSGNQVALNGNTGIIIIRASQSGNGTYNPATSVEKFILVNNASLANQSITFPSISDKQNNSSFNLSATANSGLTVSYEIVSGSANISGNTVNLTSGYGNVTIRASQSGNGTYNPAQYVERTFNVCESIGTSNVTISNSGSSTFCLPSATTLTSSINYPIMLWSNGSTNPSIAVQTSGLYTLTVGSGLCKVVSNSVQITVKTPIITPICMVTVDETSGKNKVIFEKPSGFVTSITSWKIYRESTVANQYLLQSSLSLANLSEYVDVTSFPATQAYRYKLETVDNNCNTANQSAPHKTMHLTINKGQNATTWNLIWTPYEGIPLATHRIYRGTSATNLAYLADVAGSLTSYTDASAPAVNNIYYVVELITGQSCNPTARTEAYTTVRSNVAETASTSTESEFLKNSSVTIYPNPTTGSFTISCENGLVYIITDLLGRKLTEGLLTHGKAEVSDLNLASGIYLVGVGQYKTKLVVR